MFEFLEIVKRGLFLNRNTSKQVAIHEGKTPITGLAFRPTTSAKGAIVLYISSVDQILSYMIGSRDKEIEVSTTFYHRNTVKLEPNEK